MKKCCLNCAFCIRKKEMPNLLGEKIYGRDSSDILTDEERKNALNDDFDFLGREIRAKKAWEDEYNQKLDNAKKGFYNSIYGGAHVLELLTAPLEPFHKSFPLADEFGMPEHPDAPQFDYLHCWHNLWNFKNRENELTTLNNKRKCLFFYPYDKKGNKSFEACEKERSASQDKRRFEITNWLVILGIVVSISAYFFPRNDTGKLTISIDSVESLDNDNAPTTTIKLSNPQKD